MHVSYHEYVWGVQLRVLKTIAPYLCEPIQKRREREMSNTLIIVIIVVLVLGFGGFGLSRRR